MSKTAGLGTSEYQAVNVAGVVALVIGLVSFAANFDAVLLIIPLAGLIVGAIALYQIRGSNGTQTGTWMAIVGILLSLGTGLWAGTARYREAARTSADRVALVKLVDDLWQNAQGEKLEQVYGLFTDTFRQRVGRAEFDRPWNTFKGRYALKRISSNGLFAFEDDQVTQVRVASGQLVVEFADPGLQTDRPQALFTYRNGRWAIETIPTYYPPPKVEGTAGPQ